MASPAHYALDMVQEKLRILLIDDDEFYFLLTRELIRQIPGFDCELDWRSTFEDGLSAIADGTHDVYLVDYRLGQDDGLQLLEQGKKLNRRAAIVLLTGTSSHEVYVQAMDLGATGYLVKHEVTATLLERSMRYAIKHVRALEALHVMEERYNTVIRSATDGLWDWDLDAGEMVFSPRWKAMLGFEDDEISDKPEEWFQRVHPSDRPQLLQSLQDYLDGQLASFGYEHRIRCKDGKYLWVFAQGLAIPMGRMAGSMSDVSDRKAAEQRLHYNANHDILTGLPNRIQFMERLTLSLQRQQREVQHRCAVLFIDLDGFKVINDSLGHEAGDQLLKLVSQQLQNGHHPTETIARLGGDEFAVLIDGFPHIGVVWETVERIENGLRQQVRVAGRDVFFKASIGIALGNQCYQRPEDLLRDADIAMYHAKSRSGSGCRMALFDETMHARVRERLQMENDLRQALERQEFSLHFQPIYTTQEEQIVGFEALARWYHPERGWISPAQFIGCAEETGLIVPLGWWILEEACRSQRVLQQRFPHSKDLTININISAKQLSQPDLVERVTSSLASSGLRASCLKLEITETALMDDTVAAIAKLDELRRLGVECHIDDFGTGYSSLSYLHQLPCTALKIDRSFVADMGNSRKHLSIVQTIISLAHNLGIEVIAEGVETAQHADRLRSLGCEFVQGFYFSPPQPLEALGHLAKQQMRSPPIPALAAQPGVHYH